MFNTGRTQRNRRTALFALSVAGAVVVQSLVTAPTWSQVTFSFDAQGPSMGGLPAPPPPGPMFEGDILTPSFGPPALPGTPVLAAPPPAILIPAAPVVPGPPSLGLLAIVPQEVDALSYGTDGQVPPTPWLDNSFYFSVDEFATGAATAAPGATVFNQGALSPNFEAAADSFTNAFTIAAPPPLGLPPVLPPPTPPAGNTAVYDGNGLPNAVGAAYPGVGLVEPVSPFVPGPPGVIDPGDNLDALNVDTTPANLFGPVYFSLDSGFDDPLEVAPGPNFGSAVANGFVGGDVLVSAAGGVPVVFAPAGLLGLDLIDTDLDGFPDMDSDDLDALILWENGTGVFEPSALPYDWMAGATDMLLFSVRRGSAVVGMPDSRYGIPISEGDILTTPIPFAFGGLSPFPAIFLPAEYLGLATIRSGTAVALYGPMPFNDDLDALDYVYRADCNGNGVWDQTDVMTGTSPDCNGNLMPDECEVPPIGAATNDCNINGIPDDCDIDPADPDGNGQVSADCDGDGVPDECELTGNDCNGNGILDNCDIAGPLSDDCNGNGIPDECDTNPADPDGNGQVSPDCDGGGVPDECDIAAGQVRYDAGGSYAYATDDPVSIRAADVDGDGDADLLVAVTQANAVFLQRNNGDGTFAAPVSFAVGNFPWFVATADLNGDSDADFITANNTAGTVTLRQNLGGQGNFSIRNDFAVGTGPRAVAAADFDGDGDVDLAVTNSISNNVTILRLQGFGTSVQGSATYPTGMYPYGIAAADLDRDGDADLVVSNTNSNTVSVLVNNGAAVFTTLATYATAAQPQYLALGDLDRDGDPDVVLAERATDTVRVWFNNGDGTLMYNSSYPAGESPLEVALDDVDADGDLDVIAANLGISGGGGLSGLSVLPNNGFGGFGPPVAVPTAVNVVAISAADLDGDGYADAALAADNAVLTLFNRTPPVSADCNENGIPDSCDIAAGTAADCNGNGVIDDCETNAPFRLDAPGVAPIPDYGWDYALEDLDGDGDADIARIGTLARIYVARNNGDGVFTNDAPLTVPGDPRWLASADLDGDNDADVVVGESNARIFILANNGMGVLTLAATINLAGWPQRGAIADLDGDGDLDIACAHAFPSSMSILLNAGGLSFTGPSNFAVAGGGLGRVLAARLDADNDIDLAVIRYNGNSMALLMNNGDATFAAPMTLTTAPQLVDAVAADMDGDGAIDLAALAGNFGSPRADLYLNNGAGQFVTSPAYSHPVPAGPMELVAVDLNRDGRLDLAATSLTNRVVSILRNDGAALMVAEARIGLIGSATNAQLPLRAADVNRDGRPDLVVSTNTPFLNVFFNRTPYAAAPEQFYEAFPNLPIPDGPTGAVTTPPINVPLADPVADIDVQIDIQHPWTGDLRITLIHPDGTEVVLVPESFRALPNYTATIFDDEAPHHIWAAGSPHTGRFRPLPPARLATLYDRPTLGDWRLRVADTMPSSTGTILHWALFVRTRLGTCIQPGDLNGDGYLNGEDVGGFTACYISGSGSGGCEAADLDGDGDVDDVDLGLFVSALLAS